MCTHVNVWQIACSAGVMYRPALVFFMFMAAAMSIEQHVEQKKQELLVHNPWAQSNPWHLQDKVFCLCTRCTTQQPLMQRNVMVAKRTAYSHRKSDVSKRLVSEKEVTQANGSLTLVPYGDFFRMYRLHVAGSADDSGYACDLSQHLQQDAALQSATCLQEREQMDSVFGHHDGHDTPNMPAMNLDAGGG